MRPLPLSRRAAGRIMLGVGVVGVVVSVIGIFVGRSLVTQVETSIDDSLDVSSEALATLSDTVRLAQDVVGSVQSGMATVESVTGEVAGSFDETRALLERVGDFTGTQLADSMDAITQTLPTVTSAADAIDAALRTLSRAPFGPDYAPQVPFDDAVRQLADRIAPIPGQLRSLSADLRAVTETSAQIDRQLERLNGDLATVNAQLVDARRLLDRYATTADRASDVVVATRGELGDQAGSARLLVTLVGITMAVGQIVPLWIGAQLLSPPSPSHPARDDELVLGGGRAV